MNTTSTTFNNSVSALSFTATSDYRVKKNIKPLILEEYSVNNLNPVYFKYKDSSKESLGLIAHELQEHYPFLVEGEKDGEKTQSVNYNGLISVLIKEIQELKKEIKQIKIELNKLKCV
jgi:tRNA(Ile2) C34 agmatinyltransferase TiaS